VAEEGAAAGAANSSSSRSSSRSRSSSSSSGSSSSSSSSSGTRQLRRRALAAPAADALDVEFSVDAGAVAAAAAVTLEVGLARLAAALKSSGFGSGLQQKIGAEPDLLKQASAGSGGFSVQVKPAAVYEITATVTDLCAAGRFSRGGDSPAAALQMIGQSCEFCPPGTFANEPGSYICSDCSSMSFATGGAVVCTPCPEGFMSGGYSAGGAQTCDACVTGSPTALLVALGSGPVVCGGAFLVVGLLLLLLVGTCCLGRRYVVCTTRSQDKLRVERLVEEYALAARGRG